MARGRHYDSRDKLTEPTEAADPAEPAGAQSSLDGREAAELTEPADDFSEPAGPADEAPEPEPQLHEPQPPRAELPTQQPPQQQPRPPRQPARQGTPASCLYRVDLAHSPSALVTAGNPYEAQEKYFRRMNIIKTAHTPRITHVTDAADASAAAEEGLVFVP